VPPVLADRFEPLSPLPRFCLPYLLSAHRKAATPIQSHLQLLRRRGRCGWRRLCSLAPNLWQADGIGEKSLGVRLLLLGVGTPLFIGQLPQPFVADLDAA
jgi:hypothetical protein